MLRVGLYHKHYIVWNTWIFVNNNVNNNISDKTSVNNNINDKINTIKLFLIL